MTHILVLAESSARGYEHCAPLVGLKNDKMCQSGQRWVKLCETAGVNWRKFIYDNVSNKPELQGYDFIVTLGVKACEYASMRVSYGIVVMSLPHPSGRNRAWNRSETNEEVINALRRFCDVQAV